MSILSEINRIKNAVEDSFDVVSVKGGTVPASEIIDNLPEAIASIPEGVEPNLQDKTVTENGTVTADAGYDGLGTVIVNVTGGGGSSVTPKTETWQHNTYVTLSIDIDEEGNLEVYKSEGSGTANNLVICYPQSDTYSAESEITKIPASFLSSPGQKSMPITVWWDNQSGVHNDHNNHTLTFEVVSTEPVDPISGTFTENGTYSAPEGKGYTSVTVNVSGGGGGENVQAATGYKTTVSTSMSSTGLSLTVAKTGTYTVSWAGWRSSNSGTFQSQLYIENTAYGTAQGTFQNTYGQSVTLTNVSLTAGQTIEVRARSRGTSYYMAVANLCIVQTA